MALYRWQQDCLRSWTENGYRGVVHAVTGSGKTLLALSAVDLLRERFPELRVKIVVPTIPLALQWKTALLHHASSEDQRPGFFGGGAKDDPDRRCMIYIINSARSALSTHIRRDLALRRHVLLICDEYHHDQSPQNRRIFDFLTPDVDTGGLYCSLGLSATPPDAERYSVLTRALGREVYRYDLDTAGTEGVISPFTVCEVSASFLPDELRAYRELSDRLTRLTAKLYREYPQLRQHTGDRFLRELSVLARSAGMDPEDPAAAFLLTAYRRKEISSLARARLQCGLAILDQLFPSDRVLVFCERIEQAKQMTDLIRRRYGSICVLYHSQMTKDARKRNMLAFRDGFARIMVSCRCLDEGLDVPDANIGIVMSGSAALRQRVQRLGRVIRSAPGKDAACLYYIYIRESSDDAAYLHGLDPRRCFSLRYYSQEDSFSNDLYEYAANELLRRATMRGMTQEQLRELRSCLMRGLARADHMLPASVLDERVRQAATVRERNYWNAMRAIGSAFRPADSASGATGREK